jgi:hypothetical protein
MPLSKAAQQKERKRRRDDKTACMFAVLDHYVKWLNLWHSDDDPQHPYTIECFTVHAPKKDLYGHSQQLAHYTDGTYDIRVYSFEDGDEGGPQIVTAWFDCDWQFKLTATRPPHERIAYLQQQFDGILTMIYSSAGYSGVFTK